MGPPQIVLDAAAAEIRAGERVGDRAVFRDDANIAGAIDENAVAGQECL